MPENLTSPREINAACLAAAMGRAGYVFAEVDGERVRIVLARRRKGRLEVKVLTGERRCWYRPTRVYAD